MRAKERHGVTWVVGVAFATIIASSAILVFTYQRFGENTIALQQTRDELVLTRQQLVDSDAKDEEITEVLTRVLELLDSLSKPQGAETP